MTTTAPLREKLKLAATEAVMDAAEAVMIEKGFEKSTMQDIAARAGCAVGTLYVHFKNKDELFRAMVNRRLAEIAERRERALAGVTDPLEKLRVHLTEHLRWAHAHADLVNMVCAALPMRYYDFTARMQELAPDCRTRLLEPLIETIREGQRKGKFRRDIEAEELWNMVDGFLLTVVDQFAAKHGKYTVEEQIRLAWGFLTGGIVGAKHAK